MSQESKDRLAETVVKKAVRKLFGRTIIDKIAVGPSENHYGEPSLFVTIYVKPAQKRISASQLVDTIAAAETALREIGDYRIPFVTFISPEDEPANCRVTSRMGKLAAHQLDNARALAKIDKRRPREASLRRAVSTAYYALTFIESAEDAIQILDQLDDDTQLQLVTRLVTKSRR